MIKAIFWDMDGTMVDSEPQWGIATYELSEAMGRRLTRSSGNSPSARACRAPCAYAQSTQALH